MYIICSYVCIILFNNNYYYTRNALLLECTAWGSTIWIGTLTGLTSHVLLKQVAAMMSVFTTSLHMVSYKHL